MEPWVKDVSMGSPKSNKNKSDKAVPTASGASLGGDEWRCLLRPLDYCEMYPDDSIFSPGNKKDKE
jgi:hypothetical protein